ncbi:hypothetical protein RHODGE_RHODGE_00979 [Rhodoplanes serenus]|uniref:Uncharacterized protein n=1 Tax=Rhodoplanes serenus TaxID=200615 RepID=A0A447CRQ3_9BRAD|nr:hypothetical protein RHODGE_RHODGE_00979 [Rhodoplanes serenus]
MRLDVRGRRQPAAVAGRELPRAGQPARRLRQADRGGGRHHRCVRRPAPPRHHGDSRPRPADRRARRFDRGRRGQSGPPRGAERRGLLLPPLHRRRTQRVLPPRPPGLQGRQGVRLRPRRRHRPHRMVAPLGPLDERALPPLALRLPAPRRARPGDRQSAHRRHLPAARLHRRHHRGRPVRPPAGPRAELRRRRHGVVPAIGAGPARPAPRAPGPGAAQPSPAHPRPDVPHRRSQRHRLLGPGRRRHHRVAGRAHAVQARRRHRQPRGRPGRHGHHPADRLSQAARRPEAAGRRQPRTGRLRLLRPPGAEPGGRRLLHQPRRLRRPSRLRGRRPPPRPDRPLRAERLLPARRSARHLHGRRRLRRPGPRPHDLREPAPARLRESRLLRPRSRRSAVRSHLLLHRGHELRRGAGRRRRPAAGLRGAAERVPPLCAARPLDSHRQRQLLRRHDVPGGRVAHHAAERPA